MKTLACLVTALAFTSISITAAHAGSNTCQGTVQIGKEWTMVKGDGDQYACRFQTDSKLGRRIIAICPGGSECMISIPLNKPSRTLTVIDRADRLIPTMVICPDGSECMQSIIPLNNGAERTK
jgi:hypothetical protein